MQQPQYAIELNTTERLLANLNFAIDEANLVTLIVKASGEIRRLKSIEANPDEIGVLVDEIEFLENKLSFVREQADITRY